MRSINRSRQVSLVYFLYTSYTGILSFTYFFLPLYLMQIGINGNQIGMLLFIFTATALFTSFAVGCLEDRFGARGNTVCGILLLSLFFGGLACCNSFTALLAIFFLGGLGSNLIRITMNALFLKSHDSDRQGREIGLFNFSYQFSMAIGILGGGLLLTRFGFRIVFILSSAAMLALTAFAFPLRPVTVSVAPVSRYLRDLTNKKVFLFSVALVFFYLHWGAEVACYAPFLKINLGLSTAGTGIFMGLPILFLAYSTYFFGRRRDRGISTVRLAIIAIVCSGVGIILFSITTCTIVSFLFRLVHEFGDAAFVIFTYVGIAHLFPRDRLGGTSGSMYVVMVGTQALGAWIFSAIGGSYGYVLPYLIAGASSLSAIPIILLAQAHYRFGESTQRKM
ncbi:MAG: MFS transporter [Candidatus Aureabacteria bacterium]|nr:MFS transporter [Candidatus Auribacterota bacterium]